MTKRTETTSREERAHEESVTPFLERSITELIALFGQLFTTPFAFVAYNKQFREQVTALAQDDIEKAYPSTVARPLSFFVLLMGAHLLLSGIYWRMLSEGKSLASALSSIPGVMETANKLAELFKLLSDKTGNTQAIIIIAFTVTLIIAAKAYFISMAGYLLRCPIRFKTALYATAYAFGTFIFFQYVFILSRYLVATIFGDIGFRLGFAIIAYGSLILCMLLVVRVNQVIQQADCTAELATYAAWFIGTVAWHFLVVFGVAYISSSGNGITYYWSTYASLWQSIGLAFYPPSWFSH